MKEMVTNKKVDIRENIPDSTEREDDYERKTHSKSISMCREGIGECIGKFNQLNDVIEG